MACNGVVDHAVVIPLMIDHLVSRHIWQLDGNFGPEGVYISFALSKKASYLDMYVCVVMVYHSKYYLR